MKRGVFDVLRRGFDNMLTNWPLVAIRLAETFFFAIICVLSAIAIIVPTLVSIGIHLTRSSGPEDFENALMTITERWTLLLWIVLAVFIVFVILTAIHAFVEAGCARVFADADRIAGPAAQGPRSRFKVFSMARWMAGAKDGWWPVFWIYNATWGLAGLILLIPLLPTGAMMLVFRENPRVMAASGCVGLIVTMLVGMVVLIMTALWSNRAIAEWAAHRPSGSTALSAGWAAVKSDFGRHIGIAFALVVVSLAGSSVLSAFSIFAGATEAVAHHASSVFFVTMPMRAIGTILNMIFSGAVAGWYLASYVALATE